MTKKYQVRAKIIEACEDIGRHETNKAELWDTLSAMSDDILWGRLDVRDWKYAEKIFSIEITLAHVLRAIEKTGKSFCIDEHGEFRPIIRHSAGSDELSFYLDNKVFWNLEKSFDDQEESVYEFLHTIIC